MSAGLRLDLIVRTYNEASGERGVAIQRDRWTWRLWSGSRIVSTSGSQLYSRRIDCARGAEVATGFDTIPQAARGGGGFGYRKRRDGDYDEVEIRVIDEREAKP